MWAAEETDSQEDLLKRSTCSNFFSVKFRGLRTDRTRTFGKRAGKKKYAKLEYRYCRETMRYNARRE